MTDPVQTPDPNIVAAIEVAIDQEKIDLQKQLFAANQVILHHIRRIDQLLNIVENLSQLRYSR